jgi:hypothetical protein
MNLEHSIQREASDIVVGVKTEVDCHRKDVVQVEQKIGLRSGEYCSEKPRLLERPAKKEILSRIFEADARN